MPIIGFLVFILFLPDRVFAQPANDHCAGAIPVLATDCGTTYNIKNATAASAASPAAPAGTCGGPPTAASTYDMWFTYQATGTSATITLSNPGGNLTLATTYIQLLSGVTCGSFTSLGCSSSSLTVSGLTAGTVYYIRVYVTSNPNGSGNANKYDYSMCITPPANDDCSSAISLTSASTCVNTAGLLTGATYTSVTGACGSSSGNRNDVWYSFVAKTSNPTITLSSAPTQSSIQIFSGICSSLTSVQCAVNSSTLTGSGLTIGNTYYVRIWSDNNTTGTFNICVTDPVPANDVCSGAISLTPAVTCSNTSGNFYLTTTSGSPTISGSCAGTVTYDMWYTFVAPAASATITMSSVGSSIASPGLQLLTGSCTTMYSLACGTSSISASGLITGSTYYIRVYSGGTAPTSGLNAGFNLCVTYTAPLAPANDECSGAVNLPVNGSCSNTVGTVNSATASSGIPVGCASTPIAYDVWYKFTAVNTGVSTTIAISNFGSGFAGTQSIQLFSGTCGSLASMSCGTTSITTTALTTGTTYYVRVYTTTGPAPTAFGDFKICVSTSSAPPRIGNSYVNITKNTVGGVVQNGDILEIRMTVQVSSGTLYNTRYLDNIPSKTSMMGSTSDSIRIITNEGLTYKRFTPNNGVNDDAATYKASPGAGEYNIRMNLGLGTGNWPSAPANNATTDVTGAGILPSSANPRGGGGLMFATSFRVQVTGNVGDTIVLNGGKFIYQTSAGGADVTLSGTAYQILITNPMTLCANAIGVNNASEYGGTFGSGTTQNRTTDLSFPIAGYTFVATSTSQAIGDGQYGIINNTSPRGGTNQNADRVWNCTSTAPDLLCANRMFGGHWYIKGDHSGTSNSTGKAPVAPGTLGGYMLAVNADYVASEAYRQTLTGLCPNTYYEFSAWVQNICPTCGADSTGQQNAGTATAPLNGYPGVYPNLTFSLDGIDRYSTGQVDTVGWLKKGFVFLTGASQTSATLSIRNNSQGGGGNDWVLDDINIATCFPSMSYSPTSTPSVCSGNVILIGDTVRSQFNNYTYYVWQRSQDNGSTWADITSIQTASPAYNGSQYQYITSYTVPPTATNAADSGDIYRVYTATTAANVTNPNCVANDGSAPISLTVLNCGIALKTDLLSFGGNLMNGYGILSWSTSKEMGQFHFELERSDDNVTYTRIYRVDNNYNGSAKNFYSFTDPQLITGKKWYRLAMVNEQGAKKYSTTIQLSINPVDFEIDNIVNPFNSQLSFNITTKKTSKINVELMDMQGKIVKTNTYLVYAGTNNLQLLNTEYLAPGIYTFRIQNNDRIISKKVVKNK